MDDGSKVAVIGLGALGLVALKNCLEEGFQATGFESSSYVGGLWKYTVEDQTSVLPTTIVNISKERGCFTDFPFSPDVPSQCTAKHVEDYLESYADHFNLRPSIRLETKVTRVRRDEATKKWLLEIDGSQETFDKVIMATGMNQTPSYPNIRNIELFRGERLHSKTYKRPEEFKDKRVLVVGLGNSGADTAVTLIGHASKIYLSHREGAIIIPRASKGKPVDHTANVRFMIVENILESIAPRLSEAFFKIFVKKLQDENFKLRPEWKLSPAPSLKRTNPVVSDELVPALERRDVESVAGVARVVGGNEVELTNGQMLEVDTMIYCTGYKSDFSMLDPKADPTSRESPEWLAAKGSRGKPLPRLYQNVLSEKYPESLAFMGCVAFPTGAFQIYDLAAMAVVQIWKGNSALATQPEIERAIDEHQAWITDLAKTGNVMAQVVNGTEWTNWVDRTAGTGVNEHLGWGWKGLKFWYQEPRFCNLLMGGIYSPHLFRYFDGKRKKWDGAREEIERLNAVHSGKAKTS